MNEIYNVSVEQDDDGEWYLGFYWNDIRYGVAVREVMQWLDAAQQSVHPTRGSRAEKSF